MFQTNEEFLIYVRNFLNENQISPARFSHLLEDKVSAKKIERWYYEKYSAKPSLQDFFTVYNFIENFDGNKDFQKTFLLWKGKPLYVSVFTNFTEKWENPSYFKRLKDSDAPLYFLINFYLTHKDECYLEKNPAYYNGTYKINDFSWKGVLPPSKYHLLPQTKLL